MRISFRVARITTVVQANVRTPATPLGGSLIEVLPGSRESSLITAVESFDTESLASFEKRQNMTDQVELIRRCLDAGILFLYGIIVDPVRHACA